MYKFMISVVQFDGCTVRTHSVLCVVSAREDGDDERKMERERQIIYHTFLIFVWISDYTRYYIHHSYLALDAKWRINEGEEGVTQTWFRNKIERSILTSITLLSLPAQNILPSINLLGNRFAFTLVRAMKWYSTVRATAGSLIGSALCDLALYYPPSSPLKSISATSRAINTLFSNDSFLGWFASPRSTQASKQRMKSEIKWVVKLESFVWN